MKSLAEALAAPIYELIPEFAGQPKVSRIYNDLRFHPNKQPYKEHMWISFGVKENPADIFVAIDKDGWTAGCGIEGIKKEHLHNWRRNLIDNNTIWRSQLEELESNHKIHYLFGDKYKKPIFPDIPESVFELVQAKKVWLFLDVRRKFNSAPEKDFFRAICQLMHLYLFMVVAPSAIQPELSNLSQKFSTLALK